MMSMIWLNEEDVRKDFFVVYLFVELRFSASLSKAKLQDFKFYDKGKLR